MRVELSCPEFKAYALITWPLRLAVRLTNHSKVLVALQRTKESVKSVSVRLELH